MRCIFCRNDSSISKSVEHIIPESIGNTRRVLPAGVVCDKCNNYFARKVEDPILSHSWMRNIRAWKQVPNKRKTTPSMIGQMAGTDVAVTMKVSKEGKLQVEPHRANNWSLVQRNFAEGLKRPFIFTIEDDVPKFEMSRFLAKMALEAVAEIYVSEPKSMDEALGDPYFDNVRNFARQGNNFQEWPFSQRRIFPDETLMRHPTTGDWVEAGFGGCLFPSAHGETMFAFCFYGVEFVINVGGPSITGYYDWLVQNTWISPMVERVGCKLVRRRHGDKQRHLLLGDFAMQGGLEFDAKHGYGPLGGNRR